jgi:hypothetical protein
MRILLVVIFFLLYSHATMAQVHSDLKKCAKTEQQIRLVQSKMRAGYTRAQGEKLEARLRKLRAKRAKACR